MGESKKAVKIFSFVIIIFLAIFIGVYFYLFFSSVVSAQLHIESGNVFVNDELKNENIKLKEGDLIETKENSLATIILYESVVINLNSNTIISLDELIKKHPKISQQKGETWNTFTKLSGVEGYDIQTGSTIASVRATAFGFRGEYILGGEGVTDYLIGGKEFSVGVGDVIEKIGEEIIERKATAEELQKIRESIERSIEELRFLREKEFQKKPFLLSTIKKKTGMDEEELRSYLEDIDNELIDVDELAKQSPIEISSITKIVEITKSIQETKKKINELGK
tara:strand:+ start:354 stop:1196 length:843 start_codon:yes stop_codon:yes gene_type:complete